jgi:hypothetical protein
MLKKLKAVALRGIKQHEADIEGFGRSLERGKRACG